MHWSARHACFVAMIDLRPRVIGALIYLCWQFGDISRRHRRNARVTAGVRHLILCELRSSALFAGRRERPPVLIPDL